jgi:hypothetical protein
MRDIGIEDCANVHGGTEELRYAAQNHNHTYNEVDDSAAMGVVSARGF